MVAERQFPDFLTRVAAGKVNGASPFFKFGENPDIDTASSPEDITHTGGLKLFPNAASTLSIVSTSANDTSNGTGLRSIEVYGLDADFNLIEEEVVLNGLTPVVTTKLFIRTYRMHGHSAGSLKVAAGDITATHAEGIIEDIAAGHGQSLDCTYTIPAGHVLLLDSFGASIEQANAGAGAEIQFQELILSEGVWRVQATSSIIAEGASSSVRDTHAPFRLTEKTDIRLVVEQVSSNNTHISGFMQGILIDLSKFAW